MSNRKTEFTDLMTRAVLTAMGPAQISPVDVVETLKNVTVLAQAKADENIYTKEQLNDVSLSKLTQALEFARAKGLTTDDLDTLVMQLFEIVQIAKLKEAKDKPAANHDAMHAKLRVEILRIITSLSTHKSNELSMQCVIEEVAAAFEQLKPGYVENFSREQLARFQAASNSGMNSTFNLTGQKPQDD